MEMLFLLDVSLFLLLLVLANLSKRIGEAMMIKPYYKAFYYLGSILILAALADIAVKGITDMDVLHFVTMSIRAVVALISIPVCYKYWKWLFNENMKR